VQYLRQVNAAESPSRMEEAVTRGLLALPRLSHESFAGHCEVAQRLASRLGFSQSLIACLGQLYERWDGKGEPSGLRGEAVATPVLLVTLAQDAVILTRLGGVDAALATAHDRSGSAYHPRMVEHFHIRARTILSGLDSEPTWDAVLALEPKRGTPLSEAEFDTCCEAIADFADLKSPYTLGHSPGVAALAAGAARQAGLPTADAVSLRRAGLLHDIGQVGVSAGTWCKTAPLTHREWEHIRLHSYYTERVLSRPGPLQPLASLAAQHHERMDGSGYHKAMRGQALSQPARILAAADVYQALSEARPYRPAVPPELAAEALQREVRQGRLDGEAVRCVLAEAGHRIPRVRRERPAGLSAREVEVLQQLARGLTNRDIGSVLSVSPDTVKRHIAHIYNKVGLSTRAGVTLFAMEHSLL
jgi:HD-GYP domain-containing protein (c-di-GMP phosphodiesterase class II)